MVRQRRRAIQNATIREVAERAGVSPMTVSRVINRGSHVRSETRELVLAAIKDLNYSPSSAARSLAGSEPHRIGVLYHNPSTGYLSEFLIGVLDESSRAGAQVLVEKCGEAELQSAALAKMIESGVEGVILPPPLCESKLLLEQIDAAGSAFVGVAPGHPSLSMATIRIDNEAASRELTQHLLSLGHRRFGFITGHPNQTVSAQRLNGFLSALAEAGIERKATRVEQGYFTYRSGLEAAEKLLAGRPCPTAIFAANDDMAAATSSVAHRLGLDVPDDLSIVGFDDTSIAVTVWPALTTIHQPVADMARAAVELLFGEIRRIQDGSGSPRQLLFPHRLMVRESSGPAPVATTKKIARAAK